jgi:hypothetical protein
MEVEVILLRKISQIQKDKGHMFSLVESRPKIYRELYTYIQKMTIIKRLLGEGERGKENNGENNAEIHCIYI